MRNPRKQAQPEHPCFVRLRFATGLHFVPVLGLGNIKGAPRSVTKPERGGQLFISLHVLNRSAKATDHPVLVVFSVAHVQI